MQLSIFNYPETGVPQSNARLLSNVSLHIIPQIKGVVKQILKNFLKKLKKSRILKFFVEILRCKFVNEILIVFQKNFRKCGKSLFCDYKNRKKITHLNKTT